MAQTATILAVGDRASERAALAGLLRPEQLLGVVGKSLPPEAGGPVPRVPQVPAVREAASLRRIVGQSPAMLDVFEQTRRAAHTESPVLIAGESGTGKELIAEAIHDNSLRRDEPFLRVNMAAIPDSLVESELFGHVKGSFTGATADRPSRFETAGGGTIFIDEIGDFPAPSQAKLLRVLENRTISRVGANEDVAVDVRVVAATSRDLQQMVADGEFREDLYYRLHVIVIQLPPLAQRRDDIPLLVDCFLRELCRVNRLPPMQVDPALMQYLESLPWPGNVRQLRNCLESMVVMARGPRLTLEDLPRGSAEPLPKRADASVADHRTLEHVERNAILQTLRECGGNRTRAADILGISLRTLHRRLKEWDLPAP